MAKVLETNLSSKYETKDYIRYTVAQELNETVEQLENRVWAKDKHTFNSTKYATNAYWAKIDIKNMSNRSQTYYLKSENQFTYKIDYYLVKNKKVISHIEDGVISKNPHRAFNSTHMIFPLSLNANSKATVYFKICNYNKINIDFKLVTEEYLVDYYQGYDLVEGLFFGGMLLMMLHNLFIYFLLRVRAYLYYVGYVLSLTIYFIGLFGFSERYFASLTYLFYLSSGALFIFLTLFVQSILGLKEKLPKIYQILNIFIIYFILATLLSIYSLEMKLFSYAQLLFNIYFTVVPIFIIIIISSTYYLAYFKNDTIAKFYSVVWSVIALMGILLPLQYLNIIHIDVPSNYIFQFLTLIEVLFFSFILAYKMNLIEDEKKKQEQLLVQQNKLASMGEVISMVAHQWRQPLSEINGTVLNLDIDYQKQQLSNEKFTKYLDNIELTTHYMSQTIDDFLNYFKHNKKVEEFTVAQLITGTLNIVLSTNKQAINIDYQEHSEMKLTSYRSELIQALLILINNALDACSHKKSLDDALISISVATSEAYLVISVKDNGGGIPADIIDKIYDPYFTTKHKSKGTGLGLYILKMIIEENIKGKVEIQSDDNATSCSIFIPRTVNKIDTF